MQQTIESEWPSGTEVTQALLPVNVFTSRGKLVVVAPMPGLEPEDIVVTVGDAGLVIHGQMRGELQATKSYLVHEWQIGPYIRAVRLPFPVDGTRANVTYNNGILTVAVPEASEPVAHRIHLCRVGPTSGETVGFSGVDAQPMRQTCRESESTVHRGRGISGQSE